MNSWLVFGLVLITSFSGHAVTTTVLLHKPVIASKLSQSQSGFPSKKCRLMFASFLMTVGVSGCSDLRTLDNVDAADLGSGILPAEQYGDSGKWIDENSMVLEEGSAPETEAQTLATLAEAAFVDVQTTLPPPSSSQFDIAQMKKPAGNLQSDGSWNIWGVNGYVETADIVFPQNRTYKIEIDARGTAAAGIWPNMQVQIKGVKASVTVNKTALARYAVNLNVPKGTYKVRLVFTNDARFATSDRNLYIRRLIITPAVREAHIPNRLVVIMPLGDSLTSGINGNGGYRPELYTLLKLAGYQFDFVGLASIGPASLPDKDFQGTAGARIDQLAVNIENPLSSRNPELVLLGAGGNDISQSFDVPNAPERLMALADRIMAAVPRTTVIVQTRPLRTDDRNNLVVAFNAEVRKLVAARHATGQRIRLQDNERLLTAADIGPDRIHPTGMGNKKLAAGWFSAVESFYEEEYGAQ